VGLAPFFPWPGSSLPKAETSATADPDNPANSIDDITFTGARPPRKWPIIAWENATSRKGGAAMVHERARRHEERNRHERKAVHAGIDVAVEKREVAFLPDQPQHDPGGRDQPEGHRQAKEQEDHEKRQEQGRHPSAAKVTASEIAARSSPRPNSAVRLRNINSTQTAIMVTNPTSIDITRQLSRTFSHGAAGSNDIGTLRLSVLNRQPIR